MTRSVPTSLARVTHNGDLGANFNQGGPSVRRLPRGYLRAEPLPCQSIREEAQEEFSERREPVHHSSPVTGVSLAPGARSTDKQTALQDGPTGTQGSPESGNKLQMTFRNSTRFPEGRFSDHDRLPASLRGTSTESRDHNDPRTSQDIQGTLRKPRSKVPRSSRANGLRPGTTSQRSPLGSRVTETDVKTHKEQSGTGGH
ncbi:hypothetical protein CDL15_Pgr003895 [Punica granatum]|uniref:Uncharacterized protein n=1 Tax=Punica granatum TaxID=22663 RepID=A0A218WZX5_PUNGR|nr:hypothetical protein CDL15_Pgr003895 [Punica granatum]